ncbi:MAG TPA: radical SAM protein [Candidatus Paceibacterota bacterium]
MATIEGLQSEHPADLLLVNTPLIDYVDRLRAYSAEDLLPPLGLGYIATEAATRGHNVGLIDAEAQGVSVQELADVINKTRPRYVGINALTPTVTVLDSIVKHIDPDIPIILGGAHPTALPIDMVHRYSYDGRQIIGIRGEGETVVGDILDGSKLSRLPATYWMDDKDVVRHNPFGPERATAYADLDSVPRLDRKYLINDPAIDAHTGLKEARMLATRGCPFTCKFCSGARDALGLPLRKRDNGDVIEEINDLVMGEGVQSIRLIDDLFMRSEPQVADFLDVLDEQGMDIQFDVTSRVNIMNKFSEQLWARLGQRIHEVSVGIEHGVKRVRDTAEKGILDEHIYNTLDRGCPKGIRFKLYGILGLPEATTEEEYQNVRFFQDLVKRHPGQIRASLFRFRPYPGTKYWDELLAQGWTKEEMLEMSGDETRVDDKRARHSVLTARSFGGPSVNELTNMLLGFNEWQTQQLADRSELAAGPW